MDGSNRNFVNFDIKFWPFLDEKKRVSKSREKNKQNRELERANLKAKLVPLIKKGYTMVEIGEELGGLSRANIDYKLKSLGLKTLSRKVRVKKKLVIKQKKGEVLKKNLILGSKLEELRQVMYLTQIKKAQDENKFGLAKALEYYSLYEQFSNKIPLEKLENLFNHYFKNGINSDLTITSLSNSTGICFTMINEILEKVSLAKIKSMKNYRGKRTLDQLVYLENAVTKTDLCAYDICYFLWGEERQNILGKIKRSGNDIKVEQMDSNIVASTYSNVSLVYEAFDVGMDEFETRELFGRQNYISVMDISKVLALRSSFEEKIIAQLQKIFPDEKIDKPYMPSDLRKKYFENYSKPLNY